LSSARSLNLALNVESHPVDLASPVISYDTLLIGHRYSHERKLILYALSFMHRAAYPSQMVTRVDYFSNFVTTADVS